MDKEQQIQRLFAIVNELQAEAGEVAVTLTAEKNKPVITKEDYDLALGLVHEAKSERLIKAGQEIINDYNSAKTTKEAAVQRIMNSIMKAHDEALAVTMPVRIDRDVGGIQQSLEWDPAKSPSPVLHATQMFVSSRDRTPEVPIRRQNAGSDNGPSKRSRIQPAKED